MRVDVDTTRMLISGTSRGAILSIAYVARRPELYLGAINFVGGRLGEGCGDFASVNRALFVAGSAFPEAGGVGDFTVFRRDPGLNGHFIINDAER